MKRSVLATSVMVLLSMGQVFAQARMQPPTAPPTSLPPLPQYTPTTGPLPLPTPSPSEGPGVAEPTVPSTSSAGSETYAAGGFFQQLKTETDRLKSATDQWFDVTLVAMDQAEYTQHVAGGRIRPNLMFDGSSVRAYLNTQAQFSSQRSTCYVVFDPEQGAQDFATLTKPLTPISHPQTGYAFLAGHAVGHCLDQVSREQGLNKKLAWHAREGVEVGLLPQALEQAYGARFSKDAYFANPFKVLSHPAQQQYSERVSDAFAVAWVMKLGASLEAVRYIGALRGQVEANSTQNTTSTVALMQLQSAEIERLNRVELLFDLARKAQQHSSVSSEVLHNPTQTHSSTPEVVRWIVTPYGPKPVDAQGRIIQDPDVGIKPLAPKGKSFNQLPRFGQ